MDLTRILYTTNQGRAESEFTFPDYKAIILISHIMSVGLAYTQHLAEDLRLEGL